MRNEQNKLLELTEQSLYQKLKIYNFKGVKFQNGF